MKMPFQTKNNSCVLMAINGLYIIPEIFLVSSTFYLADNTDNMVQSNSVRSSGLFKLMPWPNWHDDDV